MSPATKNKIVWGVILAAMIGLFLLGRSCGIRSVLKTVGTVKTVTRDSLVYRDTGRIIPYKVETFVKGKDGQIIHDTTPGVFEVRIEPADTAAILARYYETAHYIHQIDTGRWQITVEESITENRIKDWSLKAVSSDTSTTNTVQLKPPQKIVVFFTGAVMGKPKDPFYGAGAGLTLKTPGDHLYGVKVKWIPGYGWVYEAEVGIPIRLGKRN